MKKNPSKGEKRHYENEWRAKTSCYIFGKQIFKPGKLRENYWKYCLKEWPS